MTADQIQNQLDFDVVIPAIPSSLNKKDLSLDENEQRKKLDTQIEEAKKKEKQLKEMIEILDGEAKSLEILEFVQSNMSKIFNEVSFDNSDVLIMNISTIANNPNWKRN